MSSPRPTRPVVTPLITIWNWLFNISVYLVMGLTAVNINKILILSRLAEDKSLFGSFWKLILSLIFILISTSAVHELGHLLGGQLAKFRFHLLIIGPIKIARRDDGLQIRLSRGGWFNGMAASLPESDDNLRRRLLLFAIGGPLASLLLAAGTAVIFFIYRDNTQFIFDKAWLVEGAAITAVISFIFFLTSMKPGNYNNGMPADGGRIFTLLRRHDGAADRWCALVMLNSADVLGKRPRDWKEPLIEQALQFEDGSHDGLTAKMLGYQWMLDNGRLEQAEQYLDEAMATWVAWVSGARGRLVLEKAFFTAHYRQDVEEAHSWFAQIRHSRIAQPLQHRAKAAIFLAEDKLSEAKQEAEAGLLSLVNEPLSGTIVTEREWFKEILAKTAVTSH